MKKLIIKIGNEKHELPYNGETFSFEVSDKYEPKNGDEVWLLDIFCEPAKDIFDNQFKRFEIMAEKCLLFPTEEKCQKFADHCLKYFDKK